MNILAICPRIPEEGKKGDQVLSFYRLSYLSRNHQVRVVCFGNYDEDLEAVNKLESLGILVDVINISIVSVVIGVIGSLFNVNMPIQCSLFKSNRFRMAIKSLLADFMPGAVYAVTIRGLDNIRSYNGPIFVDMVDSMALNFSRRVEMESGLRRFFIRLEYERVKKYEQWVAQWATRSFVVSRIDKNVIGSDNVEVIPLGVDEQHFFRNGDDRKDPVIIFTGNMNYKPNNDAVLWFYRHCWEKLRLAIPDVRLVISGSNPTSDILALHMKNSVIVTGRVPSLADVINSAQVSIAPMQSGSGMQFKILEAMACGVPVVASTLGLGDIAAVDGRDILLADTPDAFVNSVLSLLNSQELRERIGEAGWQFVNENHTWNALNANFEKLTISTI